MAQGLTAELLKSVSNAITSEMKGYESRKIQMLRMASWDFVADGKFLV